jgi:hypothetical protein
MGTHTRESLKLMGDRVTDAVLRVFRGERPEFVVNPEVYDRSPTIPPTRQKTALNL